MLAHLVAEAERRAREGERRHDDGAAADAEQTGEQARRGTARQQYGGQNGQVFEGNPKHAQRLSRRTGGGASDVV